MPVRCVMVCCPFVAAILTTVSVVVPTVSAVAASRETCDVGLVRQLFVDDHMVDRMVGTRKVLNQPRRHSDKPIVTAEHPWEGRTLDAPIVLFDDEQKCYHMYYWTHYDKDDRIFNCYARSTDGIRWTKPMLGLYEGPDGTKKNNIVLRGEGRQARMRYVSLNPYAKSRGERFVMMYIDNVPGLTEFAGFSPDGIRWKTTAKIGDLRNTTGGPPTPNPRFFLIEQKWDKTNHDHRYRAIWRTESNDLEKWTGGAWAVQHRAGDDPDLEFYHATSHFLGCQTYLGLHLGYIYPYHTNPKGKKLSDGVRMSGMIDVELIVSRDTIRWQRIEPGRPFFPCGPKGSWDAGMVFLKPEIVVKDEVWFYYGAWALEHAAKDNRCAIGLARMRLDGFVHIEPMGGEGTLITKPFKLSGNGLTVNAESRKGTVRVAVLDAKENPIDGLAKRHCRPISADGPRLPVSWNGEKNLAALSGKQVRLSFHLEGKARLYAFQFVKH